MMWQPTNTPEHDRVRKLNALREAGISAYPNRVKRTHTTADAIRAYEAAVSASDSDSAGGSIGVEVTVCGRIVRQNLKGKVYFAHIEDGEGRLQLFVRIDNVGEAAYEMIKQSLDLGDFVQASGSMMQTKTGEISVNVQELVLLAKALSPLPVIKERVLDNGTVERLRRVQRCGRALPPALRRSRGEPGDARRVPQARPDYQRDPPLSG